MYPPTFSESQNEHEIDEKKLKSLFTYQREFGIVGR